MRTLILSLAVYLSVCYPVVAEPTTLRLDITVNGLVCDFCARAVEKVFEREYELKKIDIDLSKKLITIVLPGGTTITDEKIQKLIADSGYAFVEVKRNEERD